jgi:hypothetical protein
MEIPKGLQKRKDFEARIITRILSDEEFRTEFEQDPVGVIGKEIGTPLPEGVRVEIVHEEPGSLTLVIPPKASKPHLRRALSDEELEEVDGAGAEPGQGDPGLHFNVI